MACFLLQVRREKKKTVFFFFLKIDLINYFFFRPKNAIDPLRLPSFSQSMKKVAISKKNEIPKKNPKRSIESVLQRLIEKVTKTSEVFLIPNS